MSSLLEKKRRLVGIKQTLRALQGGDVEKVFIAEDADKHVVRPVLDLCAVQNVEIETVPSMRDLGKACRIDVGAACVAILKR